MAIETNLESGIEDIIRIIENSAQNPFMVSIYGWPDSGKSYIIGRVGNYFEQKGMQVQRFSGSVNFSSFKGISQNANLVLFHCGWDKDNGDEIYKKRGIDSYPHLKNREENDPNLLAHKAGKRIHLNVGIQNPRFFDRPDYSKLVGCYYLTINNNESREK